MPQMADIVVKKADGTTNVTFVAKQPSSGDKTPSVWVQDAASTYRNQRPVLQAATLWNGPKTARRSTVNIDWPIVRTMDGQPVVAHRIPGSTTVLIPTALTDVEAQEFVAQYTNALASTLMRAIMGEGYAAT